MGCNPTASGGPTTTGTSVNRGENHNRQQQRRHVVVCRPGNRNNNCNRAATSTGKINQTGIRKRNNRVTSPTNRQPGNERRVWSGVNVVYNRVIRPGQSNVRGNHRGAGSNKRATGTSNKSINQQQRPNQRNRQRGTTINNAINRKYNKCCYNVAITTV